MSRFAFIFVEIVWHLIIGGDGDALDDDRLASVELYNWETGEQCQLGDLPRPIAEHTGTVINGTPVYCGGVQDQGYVNSAECYKFNKKDRVWERVSHSKIMHQIL